MRVSSETVGNTEYTDEFENPETNDDTEFWSKESSVRRIGAAPSVGHRRWGAYVAGGVTALVLLLLIVVVSVGHVKFDRKFSTSEMNFKNLTSTVHSVISRTRDLEEHAHKILESMLSLEFEQIKMQGAITEMSDLKQALHDKISELECRMKKIQYNSTEEQCCPDGWFLFSSNCYFFSEDGRPWNSARDECVKKGAELLILKSSQEKRFVISKTKPLFHWLGLTDGRTGNWEWLDQTPYVMLRSEWMPGQPDDWKAHGLGGGEDCAHFHYDGRYNDDHCSRRYRYVCKASAFNI